MADLRTVLASCVTREPDCELCADVEEALGLLERAQETEARMEADGEGYLHAVAAE